MPPPVSSAPICLEALSQSGVQLMVLTIVMILIIHFVEAYFLNPRIFGHHLHMNAVLVLIVGSELIRNSVDRWFNAPKDESSVAPP